MTFDHELQNRLTSATSKKETTLADNSSRKTWHAFVAPSRTLERRCFLSIAMAAAAAAVPGHPVGAGL